VWRASRGRSSRARLSLTPQAPSAKGLVFDAQPDGECEATTLPPADRYRANDPGVGRVFLFLLGDEIKRTTKAGRVTCRKEMFGRRSGWITWAAQGFRYGQVNIYRPVAGLGMPVAAPGRSRSRCEDWLDYVHG
jgi:hypothetical protein